MKLKQIEIENFRCFEKITLDLHPDLTVLIAPNGGGKTSILDALRIAVGPYIKGFDLAVQPGNTGAIQIDDVRKIVGVAQEMERLVPTRIKAVGVNLNDFEFPSTWTLSREKLTPASKTLMDPGATRLKQYGNELQKSVRNLNPITLPLIGYFGTGRLLYQGRYRGKAGVKKLSEDVRSRTWAYRGCLTEGSSYKQFEDWFVWVYQSYMEHKIHTLENEISPEDDARPFKDAITVIQKAVNEVTAKETGWKNLSYRTSLKQLAMSHADHGLLPLSLLSDGIRNTVTLVADLAFRCIRLNPYLGENAALETSGIVMIDEVDMFLHPGWQQTIIGSLQRAFPQLQFVVTTHSPQVLTTVKSESIRILHDGQVFSAPKGSKGAEAQRLLKRLLGVDPRPAEDDNTILLKKYLAFVYADNWNSKEAQEMRKNLDDIYGDEEPALTEADLYIENRTWELDIEDDQ